MNETRFSVLRNANGAVFKEQFVLTHFLFSYLSTLGLCASGTISWLQSFVGMKGVVIRFYFDQRGTSFDAIEGYFIGFFFGGFFAALFHKVLNETAEKNFYLSQDEFPIISTPFMGVSIGFLFALVIFPFFDLMNFYLSLAIGPLFFAYLFPFLNEWDAMTRQAKINKE